MSLFENVKGTIEQMGQTELSGVKLESADAKLLDVGALDLDRHVAMQPAAIAYYGAMRKEATRRLAMLKRENDRWEKKQWAMAKAAVLSGSTVQWKPTLADIEARFIADNEMEIEKREKYIDKAQDEVDTLESWYEAWRQKSFSLRDHVSIDEDERWNSSNSMTIEDDRKGNRFGIPEKKLLSSDKIRDVRDIMRRREEASR